LIYFLFYLFQEPIELKKRLEEVRLLESRRSARLADQDTDFARLADMGGDRRKPSHSIEVPLSVTQQHNSRKRPPSCATTECNGGDQYDEEEMNENNAAMILVTLSLSPKSPKNGGKYWSLKAAVAAAGGKTSYYKWLGSSPGSSSASWSSGSSSPPLSDDGHNMGVITNDASASARIRTTSVSTSDEGIVVDFKEDVPRKKRANKTRFVCTWKGCTISEHTKAKIERHIRIVHLGSKKARRAADHVDSDSHDSDSHEEEFYYTEVEDDDDDCKTPSPTSPPTLSHRDMARPPHEDPEYQRQLVGNFKQGRVAAQQQHLNGRQIHHANGQTVYISSSQQQQLQNNNTSCIPTSPLAHHNYTWPPATATTVMTTSPITNTSNNAAANNYHNHQQHHQPQPQQPQQSTTSPQLIKHARASPRPSQTAAPYPSPTYVHQHHNYSSPAPASPNNVTNTTPIVHHNNSANSVLHQLSQQNVTVTTHHSNSHHHHQNNHHHQQQQQQMATVTITPNYTQVRSARGTNGGQETHQTHQLQQQQHHPQQHTLAHSSPQHHQQQQQQPQHHLQHSPTATASNRMVASNNPNCSPSSTATTATGHVHHQQHVAVQHANRQTPNSPNRRTRGENKKCRKVYGMERRDMWCTQCRWKKACSRFAVAAPPLTASLSPTAPPFPSIPPASTASSSPSTPAAIPSLGTSSSVVNATNSQATITKMNSSIKTPTKRPAQASPSLKPLPSKQSKKTNAALVLHNNISGSGGSSSTNRPNVTTTDGNLCGAVATSVIVKPKTSGNNIFKSNTIGDNHQLQQHVLSANATLTVISQPQFGAMPQQQQQPQLSNQHFLKSTAHIMPDCNDTIGTSTPQQQIVLLQC
ncbi:protein split ends-like, partial [Musca vetustissima]|uniref:protein split ends-like n=1 Tax=Musca vetustissima TaxID=27455 RepID=UPI002AB7D44C